MKLGTYSMTKDINGTWVSTIEGNLDGVYYTYLVDVNGSVKEACDPYARATGVNGKRAMVVNLENTNPKDWENDVSPNKGMSYTDAIIYEVGVRDFTINEESGVRANWKGKFLGVAQKGTTNNDGVPTGLDHLKNLGVTHVHLLPSYDFGSIDETMTEEEKAANPSKQNNWGYDPVNYNVPEGSYSTNPYDGEVRIKEMKEMVQTLHENNINVIMDVVYNHVYDAGSFGFNIIVPNYFSRMNEDGTYSNGSGCGNDTASERAMVRKYIVDSVKYWADEYHIDGFRFDLVGLLDAETISLVVEEVHKTHPDVIFYGEGWNMSTAVQPSNTIMATQGNAWSTPYFAYFSDTLRDLIKGSNDEVTWGYVQGSTYPIQYRDIDQVFIECYTANTWWIPNPTQVINYASCHDNYTLMDKINVTRKDLPLEDRIKMNNLAAAIYLTAEGIPLIHAGEELLRTKVDSNGNIVHNSYNSPDYINSIKWGDLDAKTYQNVRDYYSGLIELRKNHAILRLTTKADVNKYVSSYEISNNLVLFMFAGKDSFSSEVSDGIIVIFNSNSETKTVNIYSYGATSGTWNVCVNDEAAGVETLSSITNGTVSVKPYSAMVLIKGDTKDNASIYKSLEVGETGRIIVEYVDDEGNILDWYSESGAIGNSYTAEVAEFEGYRLVSTTNDTGKYISADTFVTFVYTDKVILEGLNKAEDGKWYYFTDGEIDLTYTGMAKNAYGWWYVKNGRIDTTYTGLATNAYGTWYMKKGKLDTTFTGLFKTDGKWLYIYKGKLDLTYTGLATNAYGTWYMENGRINTKVTGLYKVEGKWLYFDSGKLNETYTGLATNAYGTWYMENGRINIKVTGLHKVDGKWLYFDNGKLNETYTGLATNAYGTWYMENGIINTKVTGLHKADGKWLVFNKGKLDKTYTGLATNTYGTWYLENGRIASSFSGEVEIDGITYTIKKGQVI